MNKLMKKKKKGFTLIELIAVIAILAILAVVAVPRVIQYVDKSKKVAIQTQASTIYNAAEAAYNDGKLESAENGDVFIKGNDSGKTASAVKDASDFDGLNANNVATALEGDNLLNNVDMQKFGNKFNTLTLANLKALMNTNTDSIKVSSDGKLIGDFSGTNGAYKSN